MVSQLAWFLFKERVDVVTGYFHTIFLKYSEKNFTEEQNKTPIHLDHVSLLKSIFKLYFTT